MKFCKKVIIIIANDGNWAINLEPRIRSRLMADSLEFKPYNFEELVEVIKDAYQARLNKKFEHNLEKNKQIQKLSLGSSPLGILRGLAKMDDDEK